MFPPCVEEKYQQEHNNEAVRMDDFCIVSKWSVTNLRYTVINKGCEL